MNHAHTVTQTLAAYGLFGVAAALAMTALYIFGRRAQREHEEA